MIHKPGQDKDSMCSQLNRVLCLLGIQASPDTEHIQESWRPEGTVQVTFNFPDNSRESWKITHITCSANEAPCLFYYGSEGDEFGIYLEKKGLMLSKNRDTFVDKGERLLMMSVIRSTKYECHSFVPVPGTNLATKIGMQTLSEESSVVGGFMATFDPVSLTYQMWSFHTLAVSTAPSDTLNALFTL